MIPAALANHLWQSTLLGIIAAALAVALRHNQAQIRYWLWLIASLKFLLPLTLLVAIGSHLKPSSSLPIAHPAFSAAVQQVGEPFSSSGSFVTTSQPVVETNPLSAILLVLWSCGVLIVLFSWSRRWLRIRAVVHSATPFALDLSIPTFVSAITLEPGIFGIFHPVLLLPAGIGERLTPKHLEAIVAHELCHVRRRDNLAAAVHMLVESLFWFHPLVWWIGSRLLEERERACDEEVLRLGNQPNVYAESILKTCQFYLESPLPCAAGITGGDLKARILRIMSRNLPVRLTLRKKLLVCTAATAAIALPLTMSLTKAQDSSPTFEVVSVRLVKQAIHGSHWDNKPGKLMAQNIELRQVLERAYGIWDYQISGPEWIKSEHYDISAEWPPSIPKTQLPLMLQGLLNERFKLAAHHEQKIMPVYELRVAPNGPKLQATKPDGASVWNAKTDERECNLWGRSPMTQIAEILSREMGRPVLDRTGLPGVFDFHLKYAPDDNEPSTPGDTGPSIFTAVQEQLGLKLVSAKAPVDILVIDHLERIPTEN